MAMLRGFAELALNAAIFQASIGIQCHPSWAIF
jgi:hypothetical protein